MPERQSTDDNNPFAPPPEGQPDQPWQPRRPEGSDDDPSSGPSGDSGSSGSGGRWSSHQPGRSSDGFGRRPERPTGPGGGPEGNRKPGLKWDPTDPAQRRARYALLSGMWAFFFAIFEIRELALLLGALALYWAVSALRAKPKPATGDPAAPSAPAPAPRRRPLPALPSRPARSARRPSADWSREPWPC